MAGGLKYPARINAEATKLFVAGGLKYPARINAEVVDLSGYGRNCSSLPRLPFSTRHSTANIKTKEGEPVICERCGNPMRCYRFHKATKQWTYLMDHFQGEAGLIKMF